MSERDILMDAYLALWKLLNQLPADDPRFGVEARWHLSVSMHWALQTLGEEHP